MIQRTERKANKTTNIRRCQHDRIIKGPSEKTHSNHSNHNNNIEEKTQTQNNIEIELNNSKINNTSYDRQSFTNEEESDSDDDDDVPPLATRYNTKGNDIDSDDDDDNGDVTAMESRYNNT